MPRHLFRRVLCNIFARFDLYSDGLYSYGLYSFGLYSYGLCSYGPAFCATSLRRSQSLGLRQYGSWLLACEPCDLCVECGLCMAAITNMPQLICHVICAWNAAYAWPEATPLASLSWVEPQGLRDSGSNAMRPRGRGEALSTIITNMPKPVVYGHSQNPCSSQEGSNACYSTLPRVAR